MDPPNKERADERFYFRIMSTNIFFYTRQGSKVPLEEYAALEKDRQYRQVVQTTLPNGIWVSTVLLGIDISWNTDGPPLIFETMAFGNGDLGDARASERATCEKEAIINHIRICENLKSEASDG